MTTGGPGAEHARQADHAFPGIRPYHERDLAAVYAVCVQTADAGGDARGEYRSDDLMPDLFAGPYLFLEPQLAFVLDGGGPRSAICSAPRTRPRSLAPGSSTSAASSY